MTIQQEVLEQLRTLINDQPPLLEQIRQAGTPLAMAEILASAAQARGIDIDSQALLAHGEKLLPGNQELSDEQLSTIAGGMDEMQYVFWLSIVTVGLGCIAASLAKGSRKVDFATCNPD